MIFKNINILCAERPGKRTSLADFEKVLINHLIENRYNIIHSTLPFDFADIYQPRGGSYPEAIIRNAASYQNRLISSYKLITHYANLRRSALLRAEGVPPYPPGGSFSYLYQTHHIRSVESIILPMNRIPHTISPVLPTG